MYSSGATVSNQVRTFTAVVVRTVHDTISFQRATAVFDCTEDNPQNMLSHVCRTCSLMFAGQDSTGRPGY